MLNFVSNFMKLLSKLRLLDHVEQLKLHPDILSDDIKILESLLQSQKNLKIEAQPQFRSILKNLEKVTFSEQPGSRNVKKELKTGKQSHVSAWGYEMFEKQIQPMVNTEKKFQFLEGILTDFLDIGEGLSSTRTRSKTLK